MKTTKEKRKDMRNGLAGMDYNKLGRWTVKMTDLLDDCDDLERRLDEATKTNESLMLTYKAVDAMLPPATSIEESLPSRVGYLIADRDSESRWAAQYMAERDEATKRAEINEATIQRIVEATIKRIFDTPVTFATCTSPIIPFDADADSKEITKKFYGEITTREAAEAARKGKP